jgi:hypothetical protein
MKSYTLHGRDGEVTFTGEVLGESSSQGQRHNHPGDVSPSRSRDQKCNACRWQETTIYGTSSGDFIAFTVGRSTLPGEVDFANVVQTDSARELVDRLIVKSAARPFIPAPAARALAQAADLDDDIADAYDNRPVL